MELHWEESAPASYAAGLLYEHFIRMMRQIVAMVSTKNPAPDLGSLVSVRHSMNSLFWTSQYLPRCMAPALREGVPRGT